MRLTVIWSLLIMISLNSYGQLASTPPVGPRALGMGSISVTQNDSWSIFNNPAGITDHERTSGLFAYRTIFDFSPFNTVSAGIVLPTQYGTSGISVYRFGDDLFNSQMLSGMISKKVGIIGLGVRANYLQYNIEGFGRKAVFIADMGGIAQLTPELTFGALISNFTQAAISDEANERIPTIIKLGASYQLSTDLVVFMEGEKDVDLDTDLKFGLQYQVIEKVQVRTGFSTQNDTHSFGVGILLNQFMIDYGIRIDRFLGNNHNLGLIYTFPQK